MSGRTVAFAVGYLFDTSCIELLSATMRQQHIEIVSRGAAVVKTTVCTNIICEYVNLLKRLQH